MAITNTLDVCDVNSSLFGGSADASAAVPNIVSEEENRSHL